MPGPWGDELGLMYGLGFGAIEKSGGAGCSLSSSRQVASTPGLPFSQQTHLLTTWQAGSWKREGHELKQ